MVIVASNPTKGGVHATYVHAYLGETDESGIERCHEKLLKDVRGWLEGY